MNKKAKSTTKLQIKGEAVVENADVLPPEQRAEHVARKWTEYHRKHRELRELDHHSEACFSNVLDVLKAYREEASWFAENTPYPFRHDFSSHRTELIAGDVTRTICELARRGNESAIWHIAILAVELCECMDGLLAGENEESDRAAKRMQWEAKRLPYWPVLQSLHSAGNNHFPRLADKLQLGKESWLNISAKALYSLQTPRNRYLWRILRLFQEAHQIIEGEKRAANEGQTDFWPKLEHWTPMNASEREIARRSFELGKPTKANALQWNKIAIMPFIRGREPDYTRIPEFREILVPEKFPKRNDQDRVIRNAMREGLLSILPGKYGAV